MWDTTGRSPKVGSLMSFMQKGIQYNFLASLIYSFILTLFFKKVGQYLNTSCNDRSLSLYEFLWTRARNVFCCLWACSSTVYLTIYYLLIACVCKILADDVLLLGFLVKFQNHYSRILNTVNLTFVLNQSLLFRVTKLVWSMCMVFMTGWVEKLTVCTLPLAGCRTLGDLICWRGAYLGKLLILC